jgi:hypothetical protein
MWRRRTSQAQAQREAAPPSTVIFAPWARSMGIQFSSKSIPDGHSTNKSDLSSEMRPCGFVPDVNCRKFRERFLGVAVGRILPTEEKMRSCLEPAGAPCTMSPEDCVMTKRGSGACCQDTSEQLSFFTPLLQRP